MKRFFSILVLIYCSICISQQVFGFTLWQLPSQVNTIGNSYVIQTNKGHLIIMDGGMKEETDYLRGFIAALGNKVEAWIISHPHNDHVGALTEILKNPKDIHIKSVYHSRFSTALLDLEGEYAQHAYDFYQALENSGITIYNQVEPGMDLRIDDLKLKILSVTNEEITVNPYNNSSMVVRIWDKKKSFLFLGDLGVEGGDKLLNSKYAHYLNSDYVQMSHHGQQGVSEAFYNAIRFKACLWSTPTWVYNNDIGKGFNTHILKTIETREWMKKKGIKEHYISFEGLQKFE